MLDHIRPEEVLFLDIETVPACAVFSDLSIEMQDLWEEKSRYLRESKNISLEESYQSAGIYAEFGKIICIGLGCIRTDSDESHLRLTSFCGHDEAQLLSDFARWLARHTRKPFRLLCAHNGKEFDFPYLCRRMLINGIALPEMLELAGKKPWEVPHLDTMELWKFGDYKHYTSVKLLAAIFGIPTPKDDIDGSEVRKVYYEDNDLARIDTYCKKDVATVARIFQKFRGEAVSMVSV